MLADFSFLCDEEVDFSVFSPLAKNNGGVSVRTRGCFGAVIFLVISQKGTGP